MNPYKLSVEEVHKAFQNFNKTGLGKRAYVFSLMPMFVAGILFVLGIILSIMKDDIDVTTIIAFTGAFISYVLGCITQLQYGALLKDYIKSLDEKTTSKK